MITFRTLSDDDYQKIRDEFVRTVEGTRTAPYLDTEKIPTIGIGFNLRTSNVLNAVLKDGFGFDLTNTSDQSYRDQIATAVAKSYSTDADLKAALDAVMKTRHDDNTDTVSDKRNTFSFNSTDEMDKVLNAIEKTYEDKLDKWLSGIPKSRERVALFSMVYNSKDNKNGTPTTLENKNGTSKLRDAINGDKRAEAWYEIAFNTDSQSNRRLYEAAEFGLYSQGTELKIDIPGYHSFSGNNAPAGNDTGKEAITAFRFLDSKKETIKSKAPSEVDSFYHAYPVDAHRHKGLSTHDNVSPDQK